MSYTCCYNICDINTDDHQKLHVSRAGLSNVHSVHVQMRPNHQANMKTVMLKCAIEVRLRNKTNEKRSSDFTVEECGGPTKRCTLCRHR